MYVDDNSNNYTVIIIGNNICDTTRILFSGLYLSIAYTIICKILRRLIRYMGFIRYYGLVLLRLVGETSCVYLRRYNFFFYYYQCGSSLVTYLRANRVRIERCTGVNQNAILMHLHYPLCNREGRSMWIYCFPYADDDDAERTPFFFFFIIIILFYIFMFCLLARINCRRRHDIPDPRISN